MISYDQDIVTFIPNINKLYSKLHQPNNKNLNTTDSNEATNL